MLHDFIKFSLLTAVLYTSPAIAEDLTQRVTQLEQEVQQLKQRIIQLETVLSKLPTPSKYVASPSSSLLSLKSWSLRPQQVKFETYYALDVELLNNFDKEIKEVDALVNFKNLLGGHLYSIQLNHDSHIPAGGTLLDQGGRDNSRLLSQWHQMTKVTPQDVKAELVVKKIVFSDNSILSF
ncbi:MAG: hypothetical protein PHP00_15565 [Thiotrichaceae bacterium]|nr:hypothetical protein [Thiotrichaceae bacterium]